MSIQAPTLSRALSKFLNPVDYNNVFSSGAEASGRGGWAKCGARRLWSQFSHQLSDSLDQNYGNLLSALSAVFLSYKNNPQMTSYPLRCSQSPL